MAPSRQYLIRRLDSWYYDRHERYYAEKAALPLQYSASTILHQHLPQNAAWCLQARLGFYLGRTTRLIQAKTFFSDIHHAVTASTRMGYTTDAPEDHVIRLDDFITEIGRADNDVFPESWTFDDVDCILRKTFPDVLALADIVQYQFEHDNNALECDFARLDHPRDELHTAYSAALQRQVLPLTRILFQDVLQGCGHSADQM